MTDFKKYTNEPEDIFKIKDYQEWLMEYDKMKAAGKKLWDQMGLPNDIRKGWQEAAKENKLFSCGPYSVPLDVVEAIEADTQHLLRIAGVGSKRKKYEVDLNYLEEQVKAKDKKIDMLLNMVAELRLNRLKEIVDEKLVLDDEIELF